MANNFTLSNDAERDIIDIYLYTLEYFGETQAENYVDALYQRFQQIAALPTLGRNFSDIHEGARRINQQSHAIYYRQAQQGKRSKASLFCAFFIKAWTRHAISALNSTKARLCRN